MLRRMLDARPLVAMIVAVNPGKRSSEAPDVDVEFVGTECDRSAIDGKSNAAEGSLEDRQGSSERSVCSGFARFRPEQRGHGLAARRTTSHGQECEKGNRLASVHDQRRPVELYPYRPKDLDVQSRRHGEHGTPDRAGRNEFCMCADP